MEEPKIKISSPVAISKSLNTRRGKTEHITSLMDEFIDLLVGELSREGKRVVKIAAKYDVNPRPDILYNNWTEVPDGVPYDALGVVARAGTYGRYYVGKIIPVIIGRQEMPTEPVGYTTIEEGDDALAFEEVEDNAYWHHKFGVLVVENIFVKMCDGHMSAKMLRQECIAEFQRMDETVSILLCKLLGWDIIPLESPEVWERDYQLDPKATCTKGLANKGFTYLSWFLSMLHTINETFEIGFDVAEYHRQEQILRDLGINYEKLIQQINREAGREAIVIPEK